MSTWLKKKPPTWRGGGLGPHATRRRPRNVEYNGRDAMNHRIKRIKTNPMARMSLHGESDQGIPGVHQATNFQKNRNDSHGDGVPAMH